MWIYSQSSGHLFCNGVYAACGYSGFGEGKNNPAAEERIGIGPLPRGTYTIGTPFHDRLLGPCVMPLIAVDPTLDFGRSGFYIHGDSLVHPGCASHGCLVLPLEARTAIAESGDTALTVEE